MKVRFIAPAQVELDEAFACYETEQKGLGSLLIADVGNALKRIVRYPNACQFIASGLRRCPIKKFPCMLIYGHDSGTIVVVAVAHMHRQPMYWKER